MPDAPVIPAPAPAEEITPTVAGESTASDLETPIPGAEALGDAGKKALDAMKVDRNAAKAEAKALRDEFEAFRAKAEGKEAEFAKEQERRNVESAALAKANERILKAEVRAAAAGKLADPTDALRFIDMSGFEVDTDGNVDSSSIMAAIEDLAKSRPYLAAQSGTAGPVFESPGAHRAGGPAGQVTQAELDRMSSAEINAARREGRLKTLLGTR